MACAAGRPRLSAEEDRLLHAQSAGTCLLCSKPLFSVGRPRVSIVERAHIVAHSPAGPRGTGTLSEEARASIENIVLLCPTCHTLADKSPETYPAGSLLGAKRARREAVERVGGIRIFRARDQAYEHVQGILVRNRAVFDELGPAEDGSLPSLEAAAKWREAVLRDIVPGNEMIVALVEFNSALSNDSDRAAAERLRLHTIDLAQKHRNGVAVGRAIRFPEAAEQIFLGAA